MSRRIRSVGCVKFAWVGTARLSIMQVVLIASAATDEIRVKPIITDGDTALVAGFKIRLLDMDALGPLISRSWPRGWDLWAFINEMDADDGRANHGRP